ncbi:MAG: hypothetical protein HY22_09700 [[Candidatus Thermochlorobacteriaceae] bacterium GBChlB]|nr:MAG: hypothetical protein HY22_09700 [[Candidatus Thermochlorobacteriaceae] bacterium GBChlB]
MLPTNLFKPNAGVVEPVKLNGMMIFSAGDMLVLKPIKSGETMSILTLSTLISDGERADMNMIEREVKAHRKEKRRQIKNVAPMLKQKIVIDTNIVVARMFYAGAPNQCLNLVEANEIQAFSDSQIVIVRIAIKSDKGN